MAERHQRAARGTRLRRRQRMEGPRGRLLRAGAEALNDAELLGILLRGGNGTSAEEAAAGLLAERGGLAGLLHAGRRELRGPGIGRTNRAVVLAAVELARRLARARIPCGDPLLHPAAVADYLALRYGRPSQEVMGALYLDAAGRLIGERELYRGTVCAAAVEPRAVLEDALRHHAVGFVLFHTHPGGDPEPTAEDLAFTRRMAGAGAILGVRLVDHLLLAGGRWVSLHRREPW